MSHVSSIDLDKANGKMRTCGLRVRDKVRFSVRDRVGVRVSDGVRINTLYFL